MRHWSTRGTAALLIAVVSMFATRPGATAEAAHFVDAADSALVTLGKQVYAGYCAGCHGRNLQGQPLWQLDDKFAGHRAPAHDETGHTWQHSDEALFRKTKYGRFDPEPADPIPAMPPFAAVLDDHRILAALAFIKARWPLGLRIAQAMLNPASAGMPAVPDDADWRLPPNCNVLLRRQGTASLR